MVFSVQGLCLVPETQKQGRACLVPVPKGNSVGEIQQGQEALLQARLSSWLPRLLCGVCHATGSSSKHPNPRAHPINETKSEREGGCYVLARPVFRDAV